MKASSMQKPVLNLLKNPDMGGAWGVYDNNGGEVTRKTNTGHLGKNCYQIVKSGANGTTNIYQVLSLKKGTYTYSAYVKTENVKLLTGGNGGAGIWAAQKRSDGSYIKWHTNRSLTGTTDTDFDDGWVRLTQTFTVVQDNTLVEISAGMSNASGTLYVDSAQLETGEVANKLNLIKNSGFQSTTNGKLDHWSFSETPAGSGVGSPPSHTQAALINPRFPAGQSSQRSMCREKRGTSTPSAAGPAPRERSRGANSALPRRLSSMEPGTMVYCAVQ